MTHFQKLAAAAKREKDVGRRLIAAEDRARIAERKCRDLQQRIDAWAPACGHADQTFHLRLAFSPMRPGGTGTVVDHKIPVEALHCGDAVGILERSVHGMLAELVHYLGLQRPHAKPLGGGS